MRKIKVRDDQGEEYMAEFLGEQYKDSPISLKIDVGPSSTYSEFAAQGSLDKIYDKGEIDLIDYLELSSKSSMPFKDSLINKLKMRRSISLPNDMNIGVNEDFGNHKIENTQF